MLISVLHIEDFLILGYNNSEDIPVSVLLINSYTRRTAV